jgi:hypothetical protein
MSNRQPSKELSVLADDVTRPISRGERNKIIQALREQDEARRLKEAKQVLEVNDGTGADG